MGWNGPSVRLTLTVTPPAPAQPPGCLITCTHQPHLSTHWFSCRSTCLPVALSLSNKDFIVCIVVYGCPRVSEYYVYQCTVSGCHFSLLITSLQHINWPQQSQPKPQLRPKKTSNFSPNLCPSNFSIPCFPNIFVAFIPRTSLSIHLSVTDARLLVLLTLLEPTLYQPFHSPHLPASVLLLLRH